MLRASATVGHMCTHKSAACEVRWDVTDHDWNFMPFMCLKRAIERLIVMLIRIRHQFDTNPNSDYSSKIESDQLALSGDSNRSNQVSMPRKRGILPILAGSTWQREPRDAGVSSHEILKCALFLERGAATPGATNAQSRSYDVLSAAPKFISGVRPARDGRFGLNTGWSCLGLRLESCRFIDAWS